VLQSAKELFLISSIAELLSLFLCYACLVEVTYDSLLLTLPLAMSYSLTYLSSLCPTYLDPTDLRAIVVNP